MRPWAVVEPLSQAEIRKPNVGGQPWEWLYLFLFHDIHSHTWKVGRKIPYRVVAQMKGMFWK